LICRVAVPHKGPTKVQTREAEMTGNNGKQRACGIDCLSPEPKPRSELA
jgi:hypothetical protein